MPYQLQTFTMTGCPAGTVGSFGSVLAARQAMLNHSGTKILPAEAPFFIPEMQIVEGWFVGQTEYNIVATTAEERRDMLAALQTSTRPYDGRDEIEEETEAGES